jgi:hypothetical protein
MTVMAFVSSNPGIGTSRSFIVAAGQPAVLAILREPQDITLATSNLGILQPVQAVVMDAYDNIVPSALRATLLLGEEPCGPNSRVCPKGLIEAGRVEQTDLTAGYALFDRLQILVVNNNYRLSFTAVASGITNVTQPFSVLVGEPKTINIIPATECPPPPDVCGTVGEPLAKQPRVMIGDIFANPVDSGCVSPTKPPRAA